MARVRGLLLLVAVLVAAAAFGARQVSASRRGYSPYDDPPSEDGAEDDGHGGEGLGNRRGLHHHQHRGVHPIHDADRLRHHTDDGEEDLYWLHATSPPGGRWEQDDSEDSEPLSMDDVRRDHECAGGVCETLTPAQALFQGVVPPDGAQGDRRLVVGLVPTPGQLALWESIRELCLARGLRIELVAFGTFERMVMAAFQGQVHVAWYSPLALAEVSRVARSYGFLPTVRMGSDAGDQSSVCVVLPRSHIKEAADIKDRVVAFGSGDSPHSTLVPMYMLGRELGEEPVTGFRVRLHNVELGRHGLVSGLADQRAALADLEAGDAEAACVGEDDLATMQSGGSELLRSVRVVFRAKSAGGFRLAQLDVSDRKNGALIDKLLATVVGASSGADGADDEAVRRFVDASGGRRFFNSSELDVSKELDEAVRQTRMLDPWLHSVGVVEGSGIDASAYRHDGPGARGIGSHDPNAASYTFGDMHYDLLTEDERRLYFPDGPPDEHVGETATPPAEGLGGRLPPGRPSRPHEDMNDASSEYDSIDMGEDSSPPPER